MLLLVPHSATSQQVLLSIDLCYYYQSCIIL